MDTRSGVSARFSIAATETVAASALRRGAVANEDQPVARVCDLPSIVPTLLGKVEFEVSEEGREEEVLAHLLRRATAEAWRRMLGSADLTGLLDRFDRGATVDAGELVAGRGAAAPHRPGHRPVADPRRPRHGGRVARTRGGGAGVRPRRALPHAAAVQGRRGRHVHVPHLSFVTRKEGHRVRIPVRALPRRT